MPRQQAYVHVSLPHWSGYTWQPIKGTQCQRSTHHEPHHHKQKNFLSLIQLGSKQEIHQEQFTNPKFPKSQFKQFQWSFCGFSEIQDWIIIIESSLRNSSTEFVTMSNKSCAITDSRNWEEEGEEFEGSEPVKKKKRKNSKVFASSNQKRKGRSEIALPVKVRSQGSKKRLQTFKQDSGNVLTSPPFTENDCIIQNHVNLRPVRTVRSKTLTLTQNCMKIKENGSRSTTSANPNESLRFTTVSFQKHEKIEQFEPTTTKTQNHMIPTVEIVFVRTIRA